MRNPIVENADAAVAGRRRSRRVGVAAPNAAFLTPAAFLYRLGWLLVVVLSVALAVNGLALLAGF